MLLRMWRATLALTKKMETNKLITKIEKLTSQIKNDPNNNIIANNLFNLFLELKRSLEEKGFDTKNKLIIYKIPFLEKSIFLTIFFDIKKHLYLFDNSQIIFYLKENGTKFIYSLNKKRLEKIDEKQINDN